jgi:hypothetical protein
MQQAARYFMLAEKGSCMSDTIYIALLDEGVEVWRPAPAWKIGANVYIVLRPDDYDPDDERWEFPPGSTVLVEARQTSKGKLPTAVRATQADRQTA